MNCFCCIVDRRKIFSLISSWDHCQRSSPSRISDTPQTEVKPAQSLSSSFVEWCCAVVITTTLRRQGDVHKTKQVYNSLFKLISTLKPQIYLFHIRNYKRNFTKSIRLISNIYYYKIGNIILHKSSLCLFPWNKMFMLNFPSLILK